MQNWITDTVPTELIPHPYMIDTLSSKPVVVLISSKISGNYACIATYNVHTDHDINKEQGHWRVVGHNGNWDKRILGWSHLPENIYYTENSHILLDTTVCSKEIHYGEWSSSMKNKYIEINSLDNMKLVPGDKLYICSEGTYTLHEIF